MPRLRKRTNCRVKGHGTKCEVAKEKDFKYPRITEIRLIMKYEQSA